MQATPVPERRLESLQRLLGELCARGDIATLVQLPLSGRALCKSHQRTVKGRPPSQLNLHGEGFAFPRDARLIQPDSGWQSRDPLEIVCTVLMLQAGLSTVKKPSYRKAEQFWARSHYPTMRCRSHPAGQEWAS